MSLERVVRVVSIDTKLVSWNNFGPSWVSKIIKIFACGVKK